jgi:membrane protein
VLSAADHDAFQSRIPADLAYFEGKDVVLALYPSGLLIRGRQAALALAQGLIVEGVSDLAVWQTSDPRAQDVERRIFQLWQSVRRNEAEGQDPGNAKRLRDIAQAIEALPVEYEEWQVVYRKALQLGRALDVQPQLLAGLIHRGETRREKDTRAAMKGQRSSARALVGEIGRQLVQLAQDEMELAREELASDLRSGRSTLVALALAGVAGLVGLTLLLVAGALALAMIVSAWLAALILAGVILAGGAAAGYVGWTHRPRSPLALTRKSLKDNWEWLKDRVA